MTLTTALTNKNNQLSVIIQKTQNWLTQSVIQYQFCPYAKQPYEQETIAYHIYTGNEILTLLEQFARCCIELDNHASNTLETTLLIISAPDDTNKNSSNEGITTVPYLADFYDYLDALEATNTLLDNPQTFTPHFSTEFQAEFADKVPETWAESYQIASFHPDYQFENTIANDKENYTNRSPYPIFHLLRNASLDTIRATDKQAEKIVTRNINTLQNLSEEAFQHLQSLAKPTSR